MFQSEFFVRTKVNLTGEEYEKVEAIYNILPTMDKDEFCKEWKKLKDNPLIKEIAEAARKLEKEKLEAEQICEQHKADMEEFGRKMVVHADDDLLRYDAIVEEFGLGNICKWKLEENYDLEKEEREFLISKL